MQITYLGPFAAVDVPALGRTVAVDETVSVPAAVGEALCAQDCWAAVETEKPAKKAAAKKAAASETTAGDAG